MRILLTGFEPFGAVRANPSGEIVGRIAARARSRDEKDLFTAILPTEFSAAAKKIRRLIRTIRPAAIVCLGVAPSRKTISLERVALNLDDERLPDNAGLIRLGRPIARGGPAAYWSTLPLERMRQALDGRGIRANISNHAGTYVCNHVFYAARHEIERMKARSRCGLIHVPGVRKQGKNSKAAGMALSRMVAAVECCIEILREREPRSGSRPHLRENSPASGNKP